ncbi:hypothetical protein LTR51_002954 [Lithohypha guttulata]|nr:hypothetical protein LTR51_002954 [Lithohypha guttulata]
MDPNLISMLTPPFENIDLRKLIPLVTAAGSLYVRGILYRWEALSRTTSVSGRDDPSANVKTSTLGVIYWTCTVEVQSHDPAFKYLTYWLVTHREKIYSTSFVASRDGPPALPWTGPSDDEPILGAQDEDEEEDDLSLAAQDFDAYWVKRIARDKSRPIAYSPGNGSHYVKFGRSFLKLRRKGDLSGLGLGNIWLTCLGRDGGVLKRLLTEAQIAYLERDGKQTSIFSNQQSEWVQSTSRPPRDLATIVLADVQKKAIIEDIKEYLHPLTKK